MHDEKELTIDSLLRRGVSDVLPSKESVSQTLETQKITLYLGIDPTGPSLHLGHAIPLMKLQMFQALGHKIILLIGDFTAMVGDPTDKGAARTQLSREEVLENAKKYQEQASIFLKFDGDNPAELTYNSAWHDQMSFADVLDLASNMTVQQMLERDMFENRMKEGKPIYIHEFMYPLMQGYDSVAMEVDGEIGGNDQMFNMLTGRTLLRQLKDKEKFVLTMKLLEDPNGKKMGKSEGNMITLEDSAIDMFGKVMSWTDGMIVPGFELCTYRTLEEISTFAAQLESEKHNPRDFKVLLAKDIVTIYHGAEAADVAENNFNDTFKDGGISDDALEISAAAGDELAHVLVEHNVVGSKNELRRLVESGAVTNMTTDTKIEDATLSISEPMDLKVGKRRFVKISIA